MKNLNLLFSAALVGILFCVTASAKGVTIDPTILSQDSAMLKSYWADNGFLLVHLQPVKYDAATRTATFDIELNNANPADVCFNVTVLNDGSQAAPLDSATFSLPNCDMFN